MAVTKLMNHYDADMRRYTYEIVSSTISIFSAVMLFSSVNDIVSSFMISHHLDANTKVVVNFGHMLMWYGGMQLAMALTTGATRCCGLNKEKDLEEMTTELEIKSWGLLLAHLTGFASINAWGSLQQLPMFRQDPLTALSIIPISAVGQFVLQRLTDCMRESMKRGTNKHTGRALHKWDEEAEECENDVMGLTLSFNLTQVIRFFVTGSLPNPEGEDKHLQDHSMHDIWKLLGVGAMSICMMILVFILMPGGKEEEESHEAKRDSKEEHLLSAQEGGHGHEIANGHALPGDDDDDEEKSTCDELKERTKDALVITFSMTFAWCCFYSSQMWLATMPVFQSDKMTLAMTLTMFLTACSFSCIRGLDLLADADWTGDEVDEMIVNVIKGIGILVGFGWEQTFDGAVASIASRTENPVSVKMLLAIICIMVVVPVWKKILLPMAIHDGWKFGFVMKIDQYSEDFDEDDEEAFIPTMIDRVATSMEKKVGAHMDFSESEESLKSKDGNGNEKKGVKLLKNIFRLVNAIVQHKGGELSGECEELGARLAKTLGKVGAATHPVYQPPSVPDAPDVHELMRKNAQLEAVNQRLKSLFDDTLKELKTLRQMEQTNAANMKQQEEEMAQVARQIEELQLKVSRSEQRR
jgi:hypothetical protein